MSLEKFSYDNRTVKWFAYAAIFWGLIGMLAGLWAALELVIPGLTWALRLSLSAVSGPCTPML